MPELSHEDLTPAQLQAMLAAPGAPSLPLVTPDAEHDVSTGPVDNGHGDDENQDDGAGQQPPDESGADGGAPLPPADPEPDEFERTPLDEEIRAFTAGDKRIRLTGLDPDGVAAVLVAKRNPDGPKTLLDALVQVRGKDAVLKDLGYDPAAAAATVPGSAPVETAKSVDPVEAIQSEIADLRKRERELTESFELEEAAKIREELDAKRDALTELKIQSALAKAVPAAPQISDADVTRLFEADRDAAVAQYPDMASPDSPLMKEMTAEHARLLAAGDPQAHAWNANSVIAARVAAKLNLQPRRASSPGAVNQPAVPRSAPRPVHGGRSAAPPARVDEAALKRALTPHMLAGILNGGD